MSYPRSRSAGRSPLGRGYHLHVCSWRMIQITSHVFLSCLVSMRPNTVESRASVSRYRKAGTDDPVGRCMNHGIIIIPRANQRHKPDRWEVKTNEGRETLHVLHPSHSSPFKTESTHSIHSISLRIDLINSLLCSADQETLLHTGSQSSANNKIHDINILVPVVGHHEEV